ncbi:P-loop containing nucleoside triphosphate hydrolase protein [Aspergillus avenaceus]|uniref:P-loop containing nucleoside triphosphate hydrolase protein n=1 Tax=Aspergillus avenaceus TaxID=36643 RepID=A0A5N6TPA7_ASPAV|nr:P-loop containing nucleoside triphosphate hydrolase protein [Aspergillus avenaceus]
MVSSIIATCKQTRFHLLDDRPCQEIDVDGLTISVALSRDTPEDGPQSRTKGKSKTKPDARELISDTHLRLKAGVHYGLIGRNGTGKSTLLRAMADKLVPGIPHSTRIAILQQTDIDHEDSFKNIDNIEDVRKKSVLDYVLTSDHSRNDIVAKIDLLSQAFEVEDSLEPVKAIRKVRHNQVGKQLFLAQKNASLKSGARGLQARKDLKAVELNYQASLELLSQDKDSIDADAVKEDTQAAMDTLQDLQARLEAMNISDIEQQARQILNGLGFKEQTFNKPYLTLSGGWRMRCMLASILIQKPDFMILDEPTNFLDLLGIVWLENYLQQLKGSSQTTLVLVSHDRDFVNAICEEIIILRDQKLTYFKGNLSAYEDDFEAQKLYWGRMKEAQERQIAHMEATIRETTKTGKKTNDDNKLRMAKSRQKKLDDRMGVQVSATGGRFKLNRDRAGWHSNSRAEIDVPQDEKGISIYLPDPTELRYPGPLISAEGVAFWYRPDNGLVLNGVDLALHMGDRAGIMGLNGCGKSTLIRLLVGTSPPTKGKITTHSRLKLGYYAQHAIEELQEEGLKDPSLTALGLISKEADETLSEGQMRGLLSSLGLQGRIASDVPVSRLSGGQLVRLALARIIWDAPQLLILDEISTHLDFHTVTALASALSTFKGAILLISHDRFLVRSVVEGKRDTEHKLDDDFEGTEEETDVIESRRRTVYVLKAGILKEQTNGVEQFEQSLVKRVQKMLPTRG